MLFVFIINTLIIFSFVIYLFYLRYNHIIKYTNILFNLHFYVLTLYVSLFLISASLTFCVYTLELAGAGLGEVFKSIELLRITEQESLKERDACFVEDSPVQESSEGGGVHTPNERKSEGWI
jgi:hypothetical protein